MKKAIFLAVCKLSRNYSRSHLENIPKLASIRNYLYSITNPNEILFVKIMNKKIYVNSSDVGVASPLLKTGVYEEYETEIFKNLIKSNTILIDIGANIGYYTLIAASKIKEGEIYSFEPVPNNYRLLIKNININNYGNVKTCEKAISNKNGEIKIFLDKTNLGNHSLTKNNIVDKSGFIKVETISLDSFFNNLEKTNDGEVIIKIDTQGAEGLVIEGARNLLLKNNIKILMEFWPNGLRNMGTNPLGLLNKLEDYGFDIKLLDERNKSLKRLNKLDIIDRCDNNEDGIDQVNLLLEK